VPCYDPRDREDELRNKQGAGVLCELIKYGYINLESNIQPDSLRQQLMLWWDAHQKWDAIYGKYKL